MTKWEELPMGRCSLLVGLRSSSQFLDQLALLFREFWRISWGYEGTQGFKGFGKEPLLGLRASRADWVSDFVMWWVAMRISVRGWKVEVDPLSVR